MLASLASVLLQASVVTTMPAPVAPAAGETAFAAEMAVIGRARELSRAGRPQEVIATVDPLLARKDAEAATEKRRTYSSQTLPMLLLNLGGAARDKTDAVDAGPAYAEAAYLKGFALVELGRMAEAGTFYERALALSPANPIYHSEHGFWLRKQGKLDAALAEYKEAEGLSALAGEGAPAAHAKAAALRGQGYVLTDLGRLDEAKGRYEASLKLEPGNPVALHELDYLRGQRAKPGRGTT